MTYHYEKPDNLVELIETSVAKYPDNPLFGTKNGSGEYEWMTYREAGTRIDNLRAGLAQLGIGRGDAVGIIANNRAEWPITAFATYGLGARFIPMYEKELVRIWKYIIRDGGIRVLLVATPEIYRQVQQFRDEVPGLEHVFVIGDEGDHTMAALERRGSEKPVPALRPRPDDIAVLIYTSGTTGNPKGVLLSHGNFTSNFLGGAKLFPDLKENERALSILPWAHSFGQTGELYLFIHIGGSIGFMEKVSTLVSDMEKVRPTFLIAVPRVFNKIYDGLWQQISTKGGLAKKLFVMGIGAGKKRRELSEKGGQPDLLTRLGFKIADAVVFSRIRQKFGGRLKGALSGSATMNVEIGHFFSDLGIPVYDCYGLTETTPAVTMNSPGAHRPGSVGRPIDQVKVVIDKFFTEEGFDDGEIVVYGPNVMHGYHNNPDATREVMTDDGGFRTGDRGRVDKDGYLFITGRIKEQYKLENGKYVFPSALEEEIKLVSWVENAMIYGEGRAYNICLVIPDFGVLEKYAREHNLETDPGALVKNPQVQEMIRNAISSSLKGKFGGYEIPRKYIFLSEDFSLDNGMLTQTMKLKRRAVLGQYMQDIEGLYVR
ncbi:long-chain fatty acid--CoA ligase [Desulfonema ishimotonii]|uniref:Long-chain fatty acid--CoA ligase n=1 Tax=Desulfonema ishimotonii TaxID=45657 RepID=A0A401G0S8_9BACT|nr:long-chain fatty acid--CoA ligase [Desulfonema ishimotonii]GBC62807.1 long-chain fatty acid--CoA ligase [Desulfonema ishimotonii]